MLRNQFHVNYGTRLHEVELPIKVKPTDVIIEKIKCHDQNQIRKNIAKALSE